MKLRIITLALLLALNVNATVPKGSKVNNIELSKNSYLVLQVTDAQKELRQFLVTCEMTIPQERLEPLVTSGVTHIELKSGGFQSLINYWLTPATDNYVVCTDKENNKRAKLPKTKKTRT